MLWLGTINMETVIVERKAEETSALRFAEFRWRISQIGEFQIHLT